MKNIRKYSSLLIKIFVAVALLYFLGKKGFISLEATGRAFTRLDRVVPAFIALFLTTFASVLRWQLLLHAQNIRIHWLRVLQLTFIGNFFNLALPGAVSGDFVKAFYVAREIQGQRARAFGSILFDRLAGMSALVLVSAGALILEFGEFVGTPLFTGVKFFVLTAAACVLLFYTYLFLVKEHHDPLLMIFKSVEKKIPKAGSLTRIYEGLRHYHNHRKTVAQVLGISVLIHLIVSGSFWMFASAFGDAPDMNPVAIFVIVPLGLLVTAVPIAPAGVGTGHAAFSWLFHFLGTERGADIFSLFIFSQLIGGAVGGLIYLRFKSHEPAPNLSELQPNQTF